MGIIVGVDIGSSYTGVAICSDYDALNGRPVVIQDWDGDEEDSKKVPTKLTYIAGDADISSWGFKCPTLENLGRGMAIKDMFKFYLDTSFETEKFRRVPNSIPKHKNVRLWYKDFLTALHDHIVRQLRDRWRADPSATLVEYVFSIPTMWKDNDTLVREFRDLVDEAGFGNTGNVVMELTEGEAAAVFTAKETYHRFQQGEAFIVCDAGGMTADMCVLQVKSVVGDVVELENLARPNALPVGSVIIDEIFEVAVASLIKSTRGGSEEQITDQALKITRGEFQHLKMLFGTDLFGPIKFMTLKLPDSEERLSFPQKELKQMFDSQIEIMVQAIKKQVSLLRRQRPDVKLSYLFLAGGLGSSKYVQDEIVKRCTELTVLFAPDPEDLPLAVCKGLVIDRLQNFAKQVPVIQIRSSNSSYGILYKEIHSERHSGQPTRKNQLDGKKYAENQIDWLVKGNSNSRRGEIVERYYSILVDPNLASQSWGFIVVRSTLDAKLLPTFLDDRDQNRDVEIVCYVSSTPEGGLHQGGIPQRRGMIGNRTSFSRVSCKLSAAISVGKIQFAGVVGGQLDEKAQDLTVKWSPDRKASDLIKRM